MVRLSAFRLAAALAAVAACARAATFDSVMFESRTASPTVGRLCVAEGNSTYTCPPTAPSLTTATGDVSVTGNLSAANFIGSGAGLSGVAQQVTSGASGSLIYRDASGNLTASSTFVVSNSNVAIGSWPTWWGSGRNKSMYIDGAIYSNNDITITKGVLNLGDSNVRIAGTSGSSQFLSIYTSNTEAVRIVSAGYVGIGTSAPSATLHISGSILVGSPGSWYTAATYPKTIYAEGYVYSRTGFFVDGNGYLKFSNNEWIRGDTAAHVVVLTVNGVETVRVVSNNLVGIGVGSKMPSTTLHVSGTIRIASGGEACDADRAGGIRYASDTFWFCSGSAWESIGDIASVQADRITSGSTNVYARSDGSISFTTAGMTTGYFYGGKLVANGVSATGAVSGTTGYFGEVQLAQSAAPVCTPQKYGTLIYNTTVKRFQICRGD